VIYKTLMTRLELGLPNSPVLAVTGDLATLFDATVVGITACEPVRMAYGEVYITADLLEQSYQDVERALKAAERDCRKALSGRVAVVEWRGAACTGLLSDYLSGEARCADLVVTGVNDKASFFDGSRHFDIGDLVMQAGRPVLIVPARVEGLRLDHVMIGWKDTRESRRAVFDAVPLLGKAGRVSVVEIARENDLPAARSRVGDVVTWLARHGVSAHSLTVASKGDDAVQMNAVAKEQNVDLIVAGAYGHSRLREWVLGGVTRDLLLRADCCVFVSH